MESNSDDRQKSTLEDSLTVMRENRKKAEQKEKVAARFRTIDNFGDISDEAVERVRQNLERDRLAQVLKSYD